MKEFYPSDEDLRSQASQLTYYAQQNLKGNKFALAEANFESAEILFLSIKNKIPEDWIMLGGGSYEVGSHYFRHNRYDKAGPIFKKALDFFEVGEVWSPEQSEHIMCCYTRLGTLYARQRVWDELDLVCQRMVKGLPRLHTIASHDCREIAGFFRLLGLQFYSELKWPIAKYYLEQAIILMDALTDKFPDDARYLRECHEAVRAVEDEMQKQAALASVFAEVQEPLSELEGEATEAELRRRIQLLQDVAARYDTQKDTQIILEIWGKSIPLYEKLENKTVEELEKLGWLLQYVGDCYFRCENYAKAAEELERGVRYLTQIPLNNRSPEAFAALVRMSTFLSSIYQKQGKWELLQQSTDLALENLTRMKLPFDNVRRELGKMLWYLGMHFAEKLCWIEGVDAFTRCLKIMKEIREQVADDRAHIHAYESQLNKAKLRLKDIEESKKRREEAERQKEVEQRAAEQAAKRKAKKERKQKKAEARAAQVVEAPVLDVIPQKVVVVEAENTQHENYAAAFKELYMGSGEIERLKNSTLNKGRKVERYLDMLSDEIEKEEALPAKNATEGREKKNRQIELNRKIAACERLKNLCDRLVDVSNEYLKALEGEVSAERVSMLCDMKKKLRDLSEEVEKHSAVVATFGRKPEKPKAQLLQKKKEPKKEISIEPVDPMVGGNDNNAPPPVPQKKSPQPNPQGASATYVEPKKLISDFAPPPKKERARQQGWLQAELNEQNLAFSSLLKCERDLFSKWALLYKLIRSQLCLAEIYKQCTAFPVGSPFNDPRFGEFSNKFCHVLMHNYWRVREEDLFQCVSIYRPTLEGIGIVKKTRLYEAVYPSEIFLAERKGQLCLDRSVEEVVNDCSALCHELLVFHNIYKKDPKSASRNPNFLNACIMVLMAIGENCAQLYDHCPFAQENMRGSLMNFLQRCRMLVRNEEKHDLNLEAIYDASKHKFTFIVERTPEKLILELLELGRGFADQKKLFDQFLADVKALMSKQGLAKR